MPISKTQKKYYEIILIVVVALFGIVIYFWKLDKVPNGFYIDEALPGYNAYSILKTGKDEYGKAFPIVFRFYGSYNPPLYTYLTVIPIFFNGLNIFSARFVSALAGLLSVIPIYLLLKFSKEIKSKTTPIIASLFFIITPWIILHSRVGYEVSLGFFLFAFGIYFLWRSVTENKKLGWAVLFLSLSTYAAYTERFIVPIILIGFVLIFRKRLLFLKKKDQLVHALWILLITQIPNLLILKTYAFFPKSDMLAGGILSSQAMKLPSFIPYGLRIFLSFVREFLSQYLTYFSPRSLFFFPDPDLQRSIPELSVFYFWMIIPYFMGIYYLWRNKNRDFVKFILLLAFITPIPAALTKDPFATHRSLPLLLPLTLIIGLGIDGTMKHLSLFKKILVAGTLLFISLLLLWRSYFVFLPYERAFDWGYGVEHLSVIVKQDHDKNFVIDQARKKPLYIQLAFYMEYTPEKYQELSDPSVLENYYNDDSFDPNKKFANVDLRNVVWGNDIYQDSILVGDSLTFSQSQIAEHFLEKYFEIKDPLGEIIFVGYQTNPERKCIQDPTNVHCK